MRLLKSSYTAAVGTIVLVEAIDKGVVSFPSYRPYRGIAYDPHSDRLDGRFLPIVHHGP